MIFGSASAILSVIGFSAFKTAKKSVNTYYWFYIVFDGSPLGSNVALNNSNSGFVERATSLNILESPCNGVQTTQCVVGYTSTQIYTTTDGAKVLKTHGVDPAATLPTQTSRTARISSAYVREDF